MLKRSLIDIRLLKIWLCRNSQKAVYEPFIDYGTGEIREGSHYFKPLSRIITQYVEHLEHKFDGEVGVLERKHVHADGIVYIGKEANNIDDQALDIGQAQVFINKQEIMDKIMQLDAEMGRKVGIAYRGTLKRIQDKIRLTGDINLNARFMTGLVDKLM